MIINSINNIKTTFRADIKAQDKKEEPKPKQDNKKKIVIGLAATAAIAIGIAALVKKKRVNQSAPPINPDKTIEGFNNNVPSNKDREILDTLDIKLEAGRATCNNEPYSGKIVFPKENSTVTIEYKDGLLIQSEKTGENGFVKNYSYNKENQLEFVDINDASTQTSKKINVLNYEFVNNKGVEYEIENKKIYREYYKTEDGGVHNFYNDDGTKSAEFLNSKTGLEYSTFYHENGVIVKKIEADDNYSKLSAMVKRINLNLPEPLKRTEIAPDGSKTTKEYMIKYCNNNPILFRKDSSFDKNNEIIDSTITPIIQKSKGPKLKSAKIANPC